uniref:Major histocompatibility complex class I-related gene protein-like n=1 Tax=Cyprinodon variegatus TaxID=28743 RepID=A0A3Q2CSV8_CYPVA
MFRFVVFIIFYEATFSEKHSLTIHFMLSSGYPNIPEYIVYAAVDDVLMAYYDNKMKMPEPRQDWARDLMENDSQNWNPYAQELVAYLPPFKERGAILRHNNQNLTKVYVVQQIMRCELDNETQKVEGYRNYSVNGEDFIKLDMDTATWVAINPQAQFAEKEWNSDRNYCKTQRDEIKILLPDLLNKFHKHGNVFLHRKVLPSVSLLQKTPSSPVSCHATGFYPKKAVMFWRKDEKKINKDVDNGEILPNCDGTFQISATLKNSAILPEDWDRYDCVFLFSDEEKSITKLDRTVIRTNSGKSTRGQKQFNHSFFEQGFIL